MIDIEETRRIAELAHIEFDETGLQKMAAELSKILEYIDQLKEVNVGDVAAPPAEATPLREDQPANSTPQPEVARNAPSFRDGFFIVPRVIGGEP